MCAARVEYRLEVGATAVSLYDILTDVKAWPRSQGTWCIKPPIAPLQAGSTFVAHGGGVKWSITVTEADRPRRVVWTGRRVGLEAVHEWEFVEAAGKTDVLTRETMAGWMLPVVYPLAKRGLARTNQQWLVSLKSRAEDASA